MSLDEPQLKCYHSSLQELNTKPDNVILTSMYPRNELVPELDSQSMVQLQLVPSGVLLVRMKTVRSLALYLNSCMGLPYLYFNYLYCIACCKQPKHGGLKITCKICYGAQLLVLNISSSPHTQCIG